MLPLSHFSAIYVKYWHKVSWAGAFPVPESKPAAAWRLFNRMRWSGNITVKMCCRKPPHNLTSHAPILSMSSDEHVQLGFKRQLSLTPKTSVMISDPPFIFLCMAIFRLCELRHRTHHLCDLRLSIRSNTVKPSSAKVSNTWQARCSACGFIKRPVQWLWHLGDGSLPQNSWAEIAQHPQPSLTCLLAHRDERKLLRIQQA